MVQRFHKWCRIVAMVMLALASTACASMPWSKAPDAVRRSGFREQYSQMMTSQRANGHPEEHVSAQESLQVGDRLHHQGDLPGAMLAYLRAMVVAPENPAPRQRIAFLEVYSDPTRATMMFEDLLSEDPESASARSGLGLAQLAMGNLDAACASLEQALELDPRSITALSGLGAVLDRLGLHAEAQSHLLRANQMKPRDSQLLNNLGVSYLLSGDYQRAEDAFRKATSLNRRDPALKNNLGLAVGLQERYDEASALFHTAGSKEAALNNMGYVYFLNGRLEDAREHYEQALVADGENKLTVLRNLSAVRSALEVVPPQAK